LEFEERNVRADREAMLELVEELQSRTTPTAVFGNILVMGFDPAEYDAALRKLSL